MGILDIFYLFAQTADLEVAPEEDAAASGGGRAQQPEQDTDMLPSGKALNRSDSL